MKKLFSVAMVLFFCVFAKAGTGMEYPTINFPQAVTVDNICTTGETLKTIKPVSVCLESAITSRQACNYRGEATNCRNLKIGEIAAADEYVSTNSKCVKSVLQQLETSRIYTSLECTHWTSDRPNDVTVPECDGKWIRVAKKHPLTYYYNLVHDDSGQAGYAVLGTSSLTLPACR